MIGGFARAAFFVLLPAVGVGGALGVPVLICLAGALSFRPSLLRQAFKNRPPALLVLTLLLLLAVASCLWSDFPAARQALKIAILGPLGLLFAAAAARDRRLSRAGAVASFTVLAILLTIEAIGGLPLNRAAQPGGDIDELGRNVSRGASLLLALTWPAAGALAARPGLLWKTAAALALAAGGFISLQFGQFSNTLGFGLGLLAFFTAFAAPRLTLAALTAGLALWLFAAPFATPLLTSALAPEHLPYSWNARVEIWSYVADRIREQPWIGHGLDAGRAHLPDVPVHPHSASLQIWFEMGVAGVLIALALLAAAGRALVRRFADNRPAAAAAAGVLASLGVVANLSFNLWAEWWLAAMFIGGGLVAALDRPAECER